MFDAFLESGAGELHLQHLLSVSLFGFPFLGFVVFVFLLFGLIVELGSEVLYLDSISFEENSTTGIPCATAECLFCLFRMTDDVVLCSRGEFECI